jgi:hypothetical protein
MANVQFRDMWIGPRHGKVQLGSCPFHHIAMRNSHTNSRYHEPLIGVMRQKPTATKLVSLAIWFLILSWPFSLCLPDSYAPTLRLGPVRHAIIQPPISKALISPSRRTQRIWRVLGLSSCPPPSAMYVTPGYGRPPKVGEGGSQASTSLFLVHPLTATFFI